MIMLAELPKCSKCGKAVMVPLSDYGPEGATVVIKAWCCLNEKCQFIIRADKGVISYQSR